MDTNRYPLKVESLRKDITTADVRNFLDWPQADVLENIELFSNGPTSTAMLVFIRPDVAYEFLNLKEPEIDGKRVTLMPELFEEMSITLNGSWLREIEDENPGIQLEIQKIADNFQLKLELQISSSGNTISLAGVPWKIELARISLTYMIQALIMNRSANVQKRLNETNFHPDTAGIQSSGNKKSGPSTNVDYWHPINQQPKTVWKLDDPQSSVDPIIDLDKKGSTELDNPNPGKKRSRILKSGETKPETGEDIGLVRQSSNDVDKDQPKEPKRTRVLKSKPQELQTSESSVDALSKSTPVNYPASTLYQKVIRVEMDIHKYLLEHSTHLDFADSSITQFQVSDQDIDWIIGNNNEKDLRMNEEQLERLISELCIKCYSAPDEFDFDIFKDLIETENKNKNVSLIFNSKERSCTIVGLPDEVKSTYKWISKASGELSKRSKQKPPKGSTSKASGDYGTHDKGSSAQQFDAQQSGSRGYSQDYKFPDPKEKVTKAGDEIRISKSSQDRLEFTTRGNLRVSVYQGNMIKQRTEVIVNPSNEHLGHGGGLARVILDAGGPVIDDESRKIIAKQGKLQTSAVAHTSAGRLSPPIKYVIHAVGPTAHEFKDNKAGLVPTLKITFRNCLEYANDKLCVSSISLPPISSGIFAVPMPDIIQGACEAIQDFDQKNPSAVLKEVHFISNDAKTTEEMISCFLSVIG